jgi:hypothetical protein
MDSKLYDITTINSHKDPRWDEFVKRHPDGWLYHLSAWKRVLEMSFGHIRGYCLVIIDQENNRIIAGLPIFFVTSWLTGKRMVSMPFSTLATPLVSADDQLPVLLSAARALCESRRCSRLEIRTMRSFSGSVPAGFSEVSGYCHHAIDLSQPLEVLYKKLDRSCVRQRITRAEANNLSVQKGNSDSDLRDFYRLYLMTRRRVGRPGQPFRFFQSIWNEFHASGLCELIFACKDGKRLAGLLLLKYKKRVSAEWAASDDVYKNLSPNQFLFWEAIKLAHDNGFAFFDFGRTAQSNKGLMDFKNRWGATISNMYEIYFPQGYCKKADSDEISLIKRAISKICRVAPDFLQEPIGGFIYKHLG